MTLSPPHCVGGVQWVITSTLKLCHHVCELSEHLSHLVTEGLAPYPSKLNLLQT